MRRRGTTLLVGVLLVSSSRLGAQEQSRDVSRSISAGMIGDNVRVYGGSASPVSSMRDWSRGFIIGAGYESWGGGQGTTFASAAGIAGEVVRLPFNDAHFVQNFTSPSGMHAQSATAPAATLADLAFTLRVRGPISVIIPSAIAGFGYYEFHPATVTYKGTDGATATSRSQTKRGPLASIGAALDTPPIGRTAIFAEGSYFHGWTTESQLATTANSRCTSSGCDVFTATQTLTIRGGLRVVLGR